MQKLDKEYNLNLAIKAAKEAGNWLLNYANNHIVINSCSGKDIKLQADLESEKIVFEILKRESAYSILSEEFGLLSHSENEENYRWIVDPLDGSLNYLRGFGICCVSIGLWRGDEPILGVIYDFFRDNLYTGIVNNSAHLNQRKISTSNIVSKSESVLCTGFPVYMELSYANVSEFINEIQQFKKIRLLGSAAISLAMVSIGASEAYKEENIAIWDVAAGIPIVMAAGGNCHYIKGKGDNYLNVFATNGNLIL